MNIEQNSFQDRVARIKTKADEAAKAAPPLPRESIWVRLGYPASFIGAFLLGVFAAFLTRYIQYHMIGVPKDGAVGMQEMIGVGLASVAGFVVSSFLKDRQKEFASMCTMGVFLTSFAYHNLVWQFPETFEVIYGPDWVEFVQGLTEPASLYVFGNVIQFG